MAARSKRSNRSRLLAVLAVGALSSPACSGAKATSSQKPPPIAVAPTPASSAPAPPSPRDSAILVQYDAFWRSVSAASSATDDISRLQSLFPVATDPELSQLVRTLAEQRQRGKALYGPDISHANVVSVDHDVATVNDCQDASGSGVLDLRTGRKETVGVARNPVEAKLLLRDDAWKVSEVRYLSGSTC